MCCATGICGPSVDPELLRVTMMINQIKANGGHVERYNLTDNPMTFVTEVKINRLLNTEGIDVLPITMLNDEVVKTGSYISDDEMLKLLNLQIKKPAFTMKNEIAYNKVKLNFNNTRFARHKIDFGMESIYYMLKPGEFIPAENNKVALKKVLPTNLSLESAWYFNDQIEISEKLSTTVGVRLVGFSKLGDSKVYLQDNPHVYDTVYLDPMYPHRTSSALNKLEMRVIRDLVGDDEDDDILLEQAFTAAQNRVVVKGPKGARKISNLKPSFSVPMKNSRYDIYLVSERKKNSL